MCLKDNDLHNSATLAVSNTLEKSEVSNLEGKKAALDLEVS